jgi:hypothetical protein
MGGERVALPPAAMDRLAGLAGDGVIDGDHQRLARRKMSDESVAPVAEQGGLVHWALGEVHGLGDGGGEVDALLFAGLAADELDFGRESHDGRY